MTAIIDRLLSVEEARAGVLAAITGPVETETIATPDGLGRVLAEPVVARVSLPPWDNSAMDGYAVRSADTIGATEEHPVRLAVTGDVPAGKAATGTVGPGEAFRIATGAPVPPGADAVVPVEATTPLDAGGSAGPRGRDATGPLPAACLVHEPVDVARLDPRAWQRPGGGDHAPRAGSPAPRVRRSRSLPGRASR